MKDEGELLTEQREKAYRDRIAELKGQAKPPAPKPPPVPKPKDKDA